MPEIPPEALRRLGEQNGNSWEVLRLQETFYGILNMLDSHRDVPPVEDVAYFSSGSCANEVWQGWLTI